MNNNFILQLSRPELLLKTYVFKFLIIHNYLWHVLEVCKCTVHNTENRPEQTFWREGKLRWIRSNMGSVMKRL